MKPSQEPSSTKPADDQITTHGKQPESEISWKYQPPKDTPVAIATLIVGTLIATIYFFQLLAMRGSLEIATDQLHTGQRAYLIPEQFNLAEPLAIDHPVKVTYYVKNTGQTPALHVQIGGGILLLQQAFPPAFHGAVNPLNPGSVSFIGAGQYRGPEEMWLEGNSNRLLRQDELIEIMRGTKHLFAFIVIDYKDVFQHDGSTTACAVYVPELGKLGVCPTGNDLK